VLQDAVVKIGQELAASRRAVLLLHDGIREEPTNSFARSFEAFDDGCTNLLRTKRRAHHCSFHDISWRLRMRMRQIACGCDARRGGRAQDCSSDTQKTAQNLLRPRLKRGQRKQTPANSKTAPFLGRLSEAKEPGIHYLTPDSIPRRTSSSLHAYREGEPILALSANDR